jgi:Lar family restriction alleviation protein
MSEDVTPYGRIVTPKACPFCGESMLSADQSDRHHFMICGECGAQGPCEKDDAAALASWNKRERGRRLPHRRVKDGRKSVPSSAG